MGNEGECPIQHSALGWQYQMVFYQKQLKDSEFGAEHVLKGKLPNVAMESFFGTLNLKCFIHVDMLLLPNWNRHCTNISVITTTVGLS
jgi:uncharacterized transposase-like protein HI_1721